MAIDAAGATPIWRQIEEQVRRLVASGRLLASARVPDGECWGELALGGCSCVKVGQLVDSGAPSARQRAILRPDLPGGALSSHGA